jgi:hypothetical protein
MIKFKLKTADQVWEYDYPVCEIIDCKEKSERLSMTETRFVDFCNKHYEQYLMGEI